MSRFALTEDEAKVRYATYKSLDPFPEIPPALLNSADVEDYVAATGMLFPFVSSSGKLKLAAYEANLLGEVIYFDSNTRALHQIVIERDMEFVIPPNSITFVSIEQTLRLPLYIALRFNLKIRHVHKGLLLGTGPLVDPGFCGNLFIPLHNLTSNSYSFRGGEGLIWFEFTKISAHEQWGWGDKHRPFGRAGELGRNPTPTEDTEPLDYIRRAVGPERSIVSSIPDALQNASRSAEQAERQAVAARAEAVAARAEAERIWRRATLGGVLVALAIVISLVAVYVQITAFYRDSNAYLQQARHDLTVMEAKIVLQKQEWNPPDRVIELETSVGRLRDRVDQIEKSATSESQKGKASGPKKTLP